MAAAIEDGARGQLLEMLALPSPRSLRPRAVRRESIRSDDAIQWERIELDTVDGDTIPCLVLTPEQHDGIDVIAVHQHAGDFSVGKSEPAGLLGDAGLAYGVALAQRGARVVMPDLLGFEERQRGWTSDPAADERLDAFFRVTKGSSLQAKHTSDIATVTSWTTDTRGGSTELGIIGHSLGGQVALFALAVDDRLTRGVVSCGLGTISSFAAARIAHNPAWFVPGLAAAGDVPMVAAAVRQPVFVTAGRRDALFPLHGVQQVLDAFRPGLVTAAVFDAGHEMPQRVLERVVEYLVPSGATDALPGTEGSDR